MALTVEQLRARDQRRRADERPPDPVPPGIDRLGTPQEAVATRGDLPAAGNFDGDTRLIVAGDGGDPEMVVWKAETSEWVTLTSSTGGGAIAMIEDPDLGYVAQPMPRTWFGWTDPTDQMGQHEGFVPEPEPS